MEKINAPELPADIAPEPHPTIAGGWYDDDGPAIDEQFEAAPQTPQAIDTLIIPTPPEVKKTTRIISRVIRLTVSSTVNSDPILLLNEDPNRLDLIVHVQAVTVNIPRPDQWHFMIGSDKSDLYNGAAFNGTCMTTSFGIEWRTDKHTGPVWIACRISPDDVTPVDTTMDICVWSITS